MFFSRFVYDFILFFADAQRALQLLEEYRTKLSQTGDPHLRLSVERVIDIFQSTLFQALIGKLLLEQPIFFPRGSFFAFCLVCWNGGTGLTSTLFVFDKFSGVLQQHYFAVFYLTANKGVDAQHFKLVGMFFSKKQGFNTHGKHYKRDSTPRNENSHE